MEVLDTEIEGLKIIKPKVFRDARGYFFETYNSGRYAEAGITNTFVQDNESLSSKGVLRGLHWQAMPNTQAKLVRVVRGAVWDVAVDIRKGSPTFGKYYGLTLTPENGLQFYIPRGFAHGFLVLEDNTVFSYKCDNFYSQQADRGMMYNDPSLGIKWPEIPGGYILSEKDQRHPCLDGIEPW
jgi:dTDP-4-dehydrorhamnose 3,5-epimerase